MVFLSSHAREELMPQGILWSFQQLHRCSKVVLLFTTMMWKMSSLPYPSLFKQQPMRKLHKQSRLQRTNCLECPFLWALTGPSFENGCNKLRMPIILVFTGSQKSVSDAYHRVANGSNGPRNVMNTIGPTNHGLEFADSGGNSGASQNKKPVEN